MSKYNWMTPTYNFPVDISGFTFKKVRCLEVHPRVYHLRVRGELPMSEVRRREREVWHSEWMSRVYG